MTAEERAELKQMVAEAIREDWEERRRRRMVAEEEQPPVGTSLYLISLHSNALAFPDERGRAVLSQAFYARVPVRKGSGSFYGGEIEVVAYGDGKRLKQPAKVILTGTSVVGLVGVDEGVLEG